MHPLDHSCAGDGTAVRRALVAASDAAAQLICRAALEASAWDVAVVDSGVAAVVSARETAPRLIIMDLQLRDVPGREAMEWLRSNPALRSVPVVLIAGGVEDDGDIAAIEPAALLRRPVTRMAVQQVASELQALRS